MRCFTLFSALLVLCRLSDTSVAQIVDVTVYEIAEILLVSEVEYPHPIKDIDIRVVFSGPEGEIVEHGAFWDGGLQYRFRFSPPRSGIWSYCTTASDPGNAGLHGVCGEIRASGYSGNDVFKYKGWPKVSENNRFITYSDGDPLFLMVEAAMEITWKSTLDQVDRYVADRIAKGFNTVWIVPMSHQYFYPFGIRNTAGNEYFIDDELDRLNPEYFAYLDMVINKLNDAGMIVLLNPLWGRMATVYENSVHQRQISPEVSLLHARYIGARYAANNVIWLIAGDARYKEQEDRDYWNEFAETLDRSSGQSHLMTAHATGFSGSYQFFAESSWLDFHTYTPSHLLGGNFNWKGAIQARNTLPLKPTLNIEYLFEDLYDQFWLYFADTTGAARITDSDVRNGAYQGILSGAIAGTSYGGNGIWQWSIPSRMGGFGSRWTAMEALSLPGSSEMKVLTDLVAELDLTSYTIFDDVVTSFVADQNVVAASNGTTIVSYLSHNTTSVTLNTEGFGSVVSLEWRNPKSGAIENFEKRENPFPVLTVQALDTNDWILIINPITKFNSTEDPSVVSVDFDVAIAPNPFRYKTTITVRTSEAGSAILSLFDITGRQVGIYTEETTSDRFDFQIEGIVSGVYLYRVEFRGASGVRIGTGTIVSIK